MAVGLGQYALASAVAAGAVVYHAFHTLEQFYPAMLYLATSKISVVVLGNMAFVLTILFGQLLKSIFLGTLREAEVERLYELSRHEVMETCLAMTIFREEFDASFVAMFTALLFVKIFHWLTQKRLEYMETTPSVPRLAHARIVAFMALLLATDAAFLHHSVAFLLKTRRPSVLLLFAFEYMILASSVVATFLKYALYAADVVMEGRWDDKAVYIFYLELVRDLLHLFVYLVFFLIIFIYYGLPLHLVRDLYETFRNFKARVADFIRYRRITSNLNDRFADATAEELERGDATCIICREEMSAAKKLPCGHLFHVHCLRSWLERQQTCPTCRSPLLGPDPTPPPSAAPPGPAGGAVQGNAAQNGGAHLGLQNGLQGYPAAAFMQYGVGPGGANLEGQALRNAQLNAAAAAAAAAQYGLAAMYQPWRQVNPPWVPAYMPYMGQGQQQQQQQQQQRQEQQQQAQPPLQFPQYPTAALLANLGQAGPSQGATHPAAAAVGGNQGGQAGSPAAQPTAEVTAIMDGLRSASMRLQMQMQANAQLAGMLAAVQTQNAQLALGGWPYSPLPFYNMYQPVGLPPYAPPYGRPGEEGGSATGEPAASEGATPFQSQQMLQQLAQMAQGLAASIPGPADPPGPGPHEGPAAPGPSAAGPVQPTESSAVGSLEASQDAEAEPADVASPDGASSGPGVEDRRLAAEVVEGGSEGGRPLVDDSTPDLHQGATPEADVETLRQRRRQRYEASTSDGA